MSQRHDTDWTMAALARDLGVTEPALYYHFPTRRALVEAFGAALLDELEIPPCDGQWESWLRSVAGEFYDLVHRHPVLADPAVASVFSGSRNLRLLDRLLGDLRSCGFSVHDAGTSLGFVLSIVAAHSAPAPTKAVEPAMVEAMVSEARAQGLENLGDLYASGEFGAGRASFEKALTMAIDAVRSVRRGA